MKISILCTSYPRSNDDHWVTFMHSWARELAKNNDVNVVTSSGPDAKDFEIRDNVKIYRFTYFYPKKLQKLTYSGGMKESFKNEILPKIQVPFFMLSFLMKSFKIARKCDIINAHWTLSGLVAIPLKIFFKKPVVLTEHGGSIRGLPKFLNKFVFKRMDVITSAHSDIIEEIKKMGGNNVVDIKNFLNEEKFLRKHDIKPLKKKLDIKNEKIVTFIGRFEEMKDPLTFVRSIQHVIKNKKNVKFMMIGDGHLRNDVKKEINKLGINEHMILPGPTPEVDKYLAVSNIFIACSATENCFSTTILEAMLSKVPCIITKAGITEKFFIHKKYAYLVEKKNPKELGEAVISLLEDEKLRNKLSKNGLEFLEKYGFRNKVIINKIMKTFNKTIKLKN